MTATLRLTRPAPSGGMKVYLSSGDTAVASTPASVTVPAGATTRTFSVTTRPVPERKEVYIYAGFIRGESRSAALRVGPPALTRLTFDTPNALTLDAWIYPKGLPGYVYSFFAKWDSVDGVNRRSYSLNMNADGTISLHLNADGSHDNFQTVTSSNSVPLNSWSHIAGVYDGSTMRIYINGELRGQKEYSGGIFVANSDVSIGAIATGGPQGQSLSNFFGMIDEPAIYGRALSASEIQSLYNAGGAGKCTAAGDGTAVWPMSGHDQQRTSLSPYAGPTVVPRGAQLLFDSGAEIKGLVISAEGVIYFAGSQLYALNPDGTFYAAPVSLSAATGPAIDDANGYVYVGVNNASEGGWDIVRYDKHLQNQATVRHVPAPPQGGGISPLIVGPDGAVYFMSGRYPGTLTAVGSVEWSVGVCPYDSSPSYSIAYAPAVGRDGSVYVMCDGYYSPGGGIYKLNGRTGAQLAYAEYGRSSTEIMIDGRNHLRAGWEAFTASGILGAYDEWDANLNLVGLPNTDYSIGKSSLMPDGISTVRVGYYFSVAGNVSARGAHSWDRMLVQRPTPITVDGDGKIFFSSVGAMYCVNPNDGAVIWSTPYGEYNSTEPVISRNGRVYVGTVYGKIYAF